MNDLAKIQLFRPGATLPWAEIETTEHNIRLTFYDGAQEDAPKKIVVLYPSEANDIAKAIKVLADNYCYQQEEI